VNALSIKETEVAIKIIKDCFEDELAKKLNLLWVAAPLFVTSESGLNDNLTGVERPVGFDVKGLEGTEAEVVQALPKWKRMALKKYCFGLGEGLYTDMKAIRRDETMDDTHSIFVDQWDWELIISREQRTFDTLQNIVRKIFDVYKLTEKHIISQFPQLDSVVPEEITFITSEELLMMYPNLSVIERENKIAQKHKAVFICNIGGKLSNGESHGDRSPDYDDWNLNGDIIFWNPVLKRAFEVSSMGIRVDEFSLVEQLKATRCEERLKIQFHMDVASKKLPYTIGGGIGQSRTYMLLLGKRHIGEVQASIWTDSIMDTCIRENIELL
jgi:aspartate--ammonia ligase